MYKVYSAFVLACLVDNYPAGKEFAKQNHLISTCHGLLTDCDCRDFRNPLLRQWCCLCLGLCWQNYAEARWEGVRMLAHTNLIELVTDPVPEVRAAAIFALGTYIGCGQGNEADLEQTNKIDNEIVSALIKRADIVFLVRKELVCALYNYVSQFLAAPQQQILLLTTTPVLESQHSAESASSGVSSTSASVAMVKSSSTSTLATSAVSSSLGISKPNSPMLSAMANGSGLAKANATSNLARIQENSITSKNLFV